MTEYERNTLHKQHSHHRVHPEKPKHMLALVILLSAFFMSGYATYSLVSTPYFITETGENFGDADRSSNQASALDSITVLSLGDKSATSTLPVNSKTKAKTLCNSFPRTIGSYTLFSTDITNTPADQGHTDLVQSDGTVLSINPDERITLTYIPASYDPKEKVKPSNIVTSVFRYQIKSDLIRELGSTYALQHEKEVESRLFKKSVAPENSQYLYRTGNTVTLITGEIPEKKQDQKTSTDLLKKMAEKIGAVCENKPVYDSGVPKGFVAWRTTDIDRENRIAYVKIADSDLTLYLDILYFGKKILITDDSYSNNLGIGAWFNPLKFRIFTIPTKDKEGNMHTEDAVHMFVIKSRDIKLLMNALENRQTELFGRTKENLVRDSYQTPVVVVGRNVYTYSSPMNTGVAVDDQIVRVEGSAEENKEEKKLTTEYVYVLTRNNTSFVFVYDGEDRKAIESLIDSIKQ